MHPTRKLMSLAATAAFAMTGVADQNLTTNAMDTASHGYVITGFDDGSIVNVYTNTEAQMTFAKPEGVTSFKYLVVGGGGGGGLGLGGGKSYAGGGGGAGGYREGEQDVDSAAADISVSVGAGGAGGFGDSATSAASGTGSSIVVGGATISVNGGGAGGTCRTAVDAVTDASAGGGGQNITAGGKVTSLSDGVLGNAGGAGVGGSSTASGGGGGASGAGVAAEKSDDKGVAGRGGAGKACEISGESLFYAAGGAGANQSANLPLGGSGIGGNGYCSEAPAQPGLDGTGSGGGGGFGKNPGAKGGNGVVIIRWVMPKTVVATPVFEFTETVFTGDEQKPTLTYETNNCEVVWQEGDGAWTQLGVWTVTVSLKDVKSFVWDDETTEPKRLSLVIAKGEADEEAVTYTWAGAETGFWHDSSKWTSEAGSRGYPDVLSTAIVAGEVTVKGDGVKPSAATDLKLAGGIVLADGVFAVKNSMKTTKSANASAITVEDGASLVFSAEKALDLTKAPSTVTVRGTLSSEKQYLFAKGSGAGSTLDVDGGTVSVPGQLTANTYGSGEFMYTTVRNGGKIAVKNMVLGDGEVTDATIEDSGNIYFLGDVTLSSATISADNYIYAFGNNKSLTVDGATTFTFSRLYVGCNNASAGSFVATNYSFIAKSPLELSRANGQFNLGETGSKNVNFVIDNTTVTLDSGIAATVKSAAEGSFIDLKGADAKLLMPKATLTVGEAGGAAQSNGLRFRLPATPYAEPPVKKLAGSGSGALNIYGNAVVELDITDVLKHQTYPLVFEGRNEFSTDNAAVKDSGSTEAYLQNLAANMRVVKKREDGSFKSVDKSCVTLSIADGVLYADVHPTTGSVILVR